MGTADLACASLRALHASQKLRLTLAVTQPDRPQGRSLRLQPPPVKQTALELHLPILQPARARDPEFIAQLADHQPDLIVVAAYGQILPASLLAIPPNGCLNVHTSLLPKYRGAAPIQWAILNGDPETGVTIMRIVEELDAGDILTQRTTPIGPDETAAELHDRLAVLGAELLLETIPRVLDRSQSSRPQNAQDVTYARKITKQDGAIDWTLTAADAYNRIRAFTPWPGSYGTLVRQPKSLRIKVLQARPAEPSAPPGSILEAGPDRVRVACDQHSLDLLSLQREGGKPLPARDFLAGFPLQPGEQFELPLP